MRLKQSSPPNPQFRDIDRFKEITPEKIITEIRRIRDRGEEVTIDSVATQLQSPTLKVLLETKPSDIPTLRALQIAFSDTSVESTPSSKVPVRQSAKARPKTGKVLKPNTVPPPRHIGYVNEMYPAPPEASEGLGQLYE